jgi:hypothetical protein
MPTTQKKRKTSRKSAPIVKVDGFTPNQLKVIEAKVKAEIEGIPQSALAKLIYPNQTPASASVSMSRELKNANVQDALVSALAKHGISVDSVVKVVADGLKARKVVDTQPIYEADPLDSKKTVLKRIKKLTVVDHSTRLNAARTAKSFLGLDQDAKDPDTPTGNTFIFNTERSRGYIDAEE